MEKTVAMCDNGCDYRIKQVKLISRHRATLVMRSVIQGSLSLTEMVEVSA